jgi:pilus assembly protein CpaE
MSGTEKIRVLIVDDIAETRENIRKLLQFEADVEVAGAARTGKEAIELTQELKPDVVLMDINMPDMDGITATETIRRKQPYVQIVILSVQNDPNYMRRAMLAGARDFLTKPPMGDELGAAIRRAGLMAIEERKKGIAAAGPSAAGGAAVISGSSAYNGKIIMVYSPKGGTGCTTVATNLAISLANEETKVALVDGDLQFGDVAVFLNEQGKNTVLDLAPRADELDPDIVKEVLLTHAASGVKVLAAPSRPELAEGVTGEQFSKVVQYLRQLFSYTVIDTSSYLTDVVLSIIDISDLIILITTQDIPSIKNSKAFLSLIDGMKINRKRVLFMMNKYNKEIKITPEKIGESLKQPVVAVIPQDDKIVGNSVNRGVPFILDNKTQPVGRSLSSLSDQVRETLSKLESVDEIERIAKK